MDGGRGEHRKMNRGQPVRLSVLLPISSSSVGSASTASWRTGNAPGPVIWFDTMLLRTPGEDQAFAAQVAPQFLN